MASASSFFAGLGDHSDSPPSPGVPAFASLPGASRESAPPAARTRSRTGPGTEDDRKSTLRARPAPAAGARHIATPVGRSQQRKRRSSPASTRPSKRARTASLKQPPSEKEAIPEPESEEEDTKPAAAQSCCICMCDVKLDDLSCINGCDHRFCFECIEKWSERENSCPLCKNRFTKIDRVNKKKKHGKKNSKKVRARSQRTDLLPGMDALLASFAARHSQNSRLLFATAGIAFAGVHGGMGMMHPLFSDDEDEDSEPTSIFSALLRGPMPMRTSIRPHSLRNLSQATAPTRSFASNSNDRNAGADANNPLEILDSDDDDDEVVVEVL
mmetsp:Transcript_17683/g.50914  ORF Transcript_17683/g.50914 Transcript_17683/m.50914 type:complete len:328 (+) Transcript_17683:167-1150(+)